MAVLNSNQEYRFYVFYDGQNAPVESEFKIESDTVSFSTNFETMGTDASTSDNAMECPVYGDGKDPVQVYLSCDLNSCNKRETNSQDCVT